MDNPTTILYLPLRWCGFSFNFFFQRQLGEDKHLSPQYPGNEVASVGIEPENRLFAQDHAPQTKNEGSDFKGTFITIINGNSCVSYGDNGDGCAHPINQKYHSCRTTTHHQRVFSRNRTGRP